MQTTPYQRAHVVGTEKRVEIEIPFNAPQGQETRIFVDDGEVLGGREAAGGNLCGLRSVQPGGDAFSLAIRGEQPLQYGVEDAIQNMRIIDALFAPSARAPGLRCSRWMR